MKEGGNVRILPPNFRAEIAAALRFFVVGCVATSVHVLVAFSLIHWTELPVLAVNTVAFLIAFLASFLGNHLWTFGGATPALVSLPRYATVAAAAYGANTTILFVLIRSTDMGPRAAIVISTTIVPLCSFLASRLWAFNYGPSGR